MRGTTCLECERLRGQAKRPIRVFTAAAEALDTFSLKLRTLDKRTLEELDRLQSEVGQAEQGRGGAVAEAEQHHASCRVWQEQNQRRPPG